MIQSHVPEHTELHYLLECVAGYGEARRMIQFKEKARRHQHVRTSLLTYPILMAADILLDHRRGPRRRGPAPHVELVRATWPCGSTPLRRGQQVYVAVNPPVAAAA